MAPSRYYLALYGPAGAGKTALASHLVEHCGFACLDFQDYLSCARALRSCRWVITGITRLEQLTGLRSAGASLVRVTGGASRAGTYPGAGVVPDFRLHYATDFSDAPWWRIWLISWLHTQSAFRATAPAEDSAHPHVHSRHPSRAA